MKIFQCNNCNNPVFFENTSCEKCGANLGYHDTSFNMLYTFGKEFSLADGSSYQYCSNHKHDACNWLVPANGNSEYCKACSLNNLIPNLEDEINLDKWQQIERWKHRLIYSLQRFNLPLNNKIENPESGLCFDFIGRRIAGDQSIPVKTGHANGVITINIEEADSVHREYMRKAMDEPYRTLIGHLRHEVGHYYWDLLISKNPQRLERFRQIFGNEELDYGHALERYYQDGAPNDWSNHFISEYATSHPWEDWAETWAHYLHIVDTLESAYAFGMKLNPTLTGITTMNMDANFNPYFEKDFDKMLETCLPLTFAVNAINRSMGQPDLYPFVFNASVIQKLRFVHECLN
ncbi:zinc-binding metallopeptidase family protein [Portibacter lacus]|uniref:Zinc-ribbon domain-containing protein n=1 Tax=Portibacter lacus TaxID=1099794 RepID=A0AA37WE62_9BACT|nr:putative zinc-binding metallopeptidase [Portibacter lacus]GLR16394.1 hypothetical protein GCM10007940_10090 [Portibacter lacus]